MIISIDGLDCSGKETLANVLGAKLRLKFPIPVRVISFPDYTSESGRFIKKLLSGDLKHIRSIIPDDEWVGIITRLFVINRAEFFATHKDIDPENEILICDRYSASNILYQGQGLDNHELYQLVQFNNQLDYDVYNNPKPTISIFLRVSFSELKKRLRARKVSKAGVDNDVYEDLQILKTSYHLSEYLITSGIGKDIFTNIINQTIYSNGELVVYSANDCADQIIDFIENAINKAKEKANIKVKEETKPEEKGVETNEIND